MAEQDDKALQLEIADLKQKISDFGIVVEEKRRAAQGMIKSAEGLLETIGTYKRRLFQLEHPILPVDRSNVVLTNGEPVPADRHHTELDSSGQQKAYVVLSAEERAKGFVKPVRYRYIHTKCGEVTTMSRPLAETYARDPTFYDGTFCSFCRKHFPLDQFEWDDELREKLG
jgi:hypothetical protein